MSNKALINFVKQASGRHGIGLRVWRVDDETVWISDGFVLITSTDMSQLGKHLPGGLPYIDDEVVYHWPDRYRYVSTERRLAAIIDRTKTDTASGCVYKTHWLYRIETADGTIDLAVFSTDGGDLIAVDSIYLDLLDSSQEYTYTSRRIGMGQAVSVTTKECLAKEHSCGSTIYVQRAPETIMHVMQYPITIGIDELIPAALRAAGIEPASPVEETI